MKQFLGFLVMIVLISSSCRRREIPTPVTVKAEVNFRFANFVGTEPLALIKSKYINAAGDTFTVKSYSYYISNISLTTADGKTFVEPESYHLIKETDSASKTFLIKDVPVGNYTSIKFLIGVDEGRDTSGAQTGALDPINGMYWDWHSGYIMARMEGTSPQANTSVHMIAFHLGGYKGAFSVLKWVTLPLPVAAAVAKGKSPVINLRSDVLEWFKTPTTISFTQLPLVESESQDGRTIADNYVDMFTVDHVDN